MHSADRQKSAHPLESHHTIRSLACLRQDGVVIDTDAFRTSVSRQRLAVEIIIVMGLSLGQSAIYSILRII